MAKDQSSGSPQPVDTVRIIVGGVAALAGFILIAIALFVATGKYTTSNDVVAVLGSVTGVVGTVVGAIFGVNVGSAGTAKANAARDSAEKDAKRLALLVPPEKATEAASILSS
jgi:hypothetical protein